MKRLLFFLLFLGALPTLPAQEGDWLTWFERSGGMETPRYQATLDYCRRLDSASAMISLAFFGKSAQGRDLPVLILDREGYTDPALIHASGRAVILIQACIHPGESEGKDAGMMLFRDLAIKSVNNPLYVSGILDKVSLVFLPVFNADGHERFGPYNRINQNGPREMGWRTTALNLNLNRDYLKADSPEMQAWLRLFNTWMPDFFIDCHTTDGADYQYVITYLMEVFGDMEEDLTAWSKETFLPRMSENMKEKGYPVFPYVDFRNWHDPRSGLETGVAPPMLSQGYTALRNRPGLLLETHMLKPYRLRVEATYECLVISLKIVAEQAARLKQLVRNADNKTADSAFLAAPFPLRFETSRTDSILVDFLGVEYDMIKSDLTGGDWFRYSSVPATFKLPLFSRSVPVTTVSLPLAYIVPAEWAEIIDRFEGHGIHVTRTVREERVPVQTYRFRNPSWQPFPYEGRHTMQNIEYDVISAEIVFPAGSALVEVAQPAGRIIPHLLEPKGNGSFLFWGFFDAIFEQKEYGESYVLETLAREMLASDAKLKEEFDTKKASDSTFAKNPQAMLNWFYNRSPFADSRKMVYPVGRILDPAIVDKLRR